MNFTFHGKRITGCLVVIPENEVAFADEMENYDFPVKNSQRLMRGIGLDRRRVVRSATTCASDLCIRGLRHLFEQGHLAPEDIDALILVTETPDYFMPPTSNVIQGALGLGHDTLCLDINQGCAGFVVGLAQAFMLLDQPAINKVVLLNADTLSRTASPKDRNAFPLLGDAASIVVVEDHPSRDDTIHASVKMDGARHQAIMIPAGGFRMPTSQTTSAPKKFDDGNSRSLNHYHMEGIDVLNFVMEDIPPLVDALLASAGRSKADIDYFMFHQPNPFMLRKLAAEMEVPIEKMPHDLVSIYGNNSSATIPTAITHHFGDATLTRAFSLCLSGFGVGLTWSAMLLRVGPLDFCEFLAFKE